MDNKYIAKQYKNLWVECWERADWETNKPEFNITLVHPSKTLLANFYITDADRKASAKGDLSIYEYSNNKVNYLTHDNFISHFCDNDISFGEYLLNEIKTRLNNLSRDYSANETVDRFKLDKDKRFLTLKTKDNSFYLILGVNLNKDYITEVVNKSLEQYEPLIIEENSETRFSLKTLKSGNNICRINFLDKLSKEDGEIIAKKFLLQLKQHNQKLANPRSLKYGISLYDEYSKYIDDYNKAAKELKDKILKLTFNGTKMKKFEYLTEQERKINSEISQENIKLYNLNSTNTYDNYSKGMRYRSLIEQLEKKTKDMESWNETTSWVNNTCHLDCPFSSINDLGLKGNQHTYLHSSGDIEKLKEFIRNNNSKEFYITYVDNNGNTYVHKSRLFYNNGVAEFKKGSSKHGHYIDHNWERIDYFDK